VTPKRLLRGFLYLAIWSSHAEVHRVCERSPISNFRDLFLLRFLNQISFFPRRFVQLCIRKVLFAARGNEISDRRDLLSDVLNFFWSLLL
jgi:hypothetical protein